MSATCLVLLATFSVVYLGRFTGPGVPNALIDSQQGLVTSVARSLSVSISRSMEKLITAAAGYREDPGRDARRMLTQLAADKAAWGGLVVLDGATRSPIVAAGNKVTLASLPKAVNEGIVVPMVDGNDPRLLMAVPLVDGRLLLGESHLGVRPLRLNPDGRQALLVALPSGATALAQGTPLPADDPMLALLQDTISQAGDERVVTRTGTARTLQPVLGGAAQPAGSGQPAVPVLTVADVDRYGFLIVSVVHTPVAEGRSPWRVLPVAAAPALAAALVLMIMWLALVRPLRRLVRQAKAVACGESVPPVRSGAAEIRRIAHALQRLGPRHQTRPRSVSGGITATWAVLVATIVIAGSAGTAAVTFGEPDQDLPIQVVRDTENQVAAVGSALNDVLAEGFGRLAVVAQQHSDGDAAEIQLALRELVERNERFRSAYLLPSDGRPTALAGRKPLRDGGPVLGDGGLILHNLAGPIPIVYAYSPISQGRSLIAEFDVKYFAALLRRVDGRLRVVDLDTRTIVDTDGYLAFAQISTPVLRTAVGKALAGEAGADVVDLAGTRTLLVTRPLAPAGPTAHLKWSIIAERSVADFDLPGNEFRRATILIGVVAAGIALLFVGWYYFFLIRPLRRLSQEARALAQGDTATVIHPRWLNEVGTIAVCLEICRQVAVHGAQRVAGAVRLRGADGAHTVVLPRIPDGRRGDRGVARKRRR